MPPILKTVFALLLILPAASVVAQNADWIVDKPPYDMPDELILIADDACRSALEQSSIPVMELQSLLGSESDAIYQAMQDPQTLNAAGERAEALRTRLGTLERLPSVQLQFVLSMLAEKAGDTRLSELHRVMGQALLARMEVRGLGQSPDQALRPCLVENEYSWLQVRSTYSKHHLQRVETHDGRAFDVLEIDDNQGRRRLVYFDITPLFEAYDRSVNAAGN